MLYSKLPPPDYKFFSLSEIALYRYFEGNDNFVGGNSPS